MIANYGYMDGSGQFYITINTDKCSICDGYPCVSACPVKMFEIEVDDYDDTVAIIKKEFRKSVKYNCSPCKPVVNCLPLPCVTACPFEAISHSW